MAVPKALLIFSCPGFEQVAQSVILCAMQEDPVSFFTLDRFLLSLGQFGHVPNLRGHGSLTPHGLAEFQKGLWPAPWTKTPKSAMPTVIPMTTSSILPGISYESGNLRPKTPYFPSIHHKLPGASRCSAISLVLGCAGTQKAKAYLDTRTNTGGCQKVKRWTLGKSGLAARVARLVFALARPWVNITTIVYLYKDVHHSFNIFMRVEPQGRSFLDHHATLRSGNFLVCLRQVPMGPESRTPGSRVRSCGTPRKRSLPPGGVPIQRSSSKGHEF